MKKGKSESTIGAGGPDPEVLLRFALVSQIESRVQRGETARRVIRDIAGHTHTHPVTGEGRRVVVRTLQRWYRAYLDQGFDGLIPGKREKADGPVALKEELVEFCRHEKASDPPASIPELIRRATLRGIVKPGEQVDRSTVWRTLRRVGVSTARRKGAADRDSRRFAYPNRLDCILCDGKHFRVGASELRRVALVFLDDATRVGLHSVVGTSENTELFLRGVYELIARFGYFGLIYVDRGPGFISLDTLHVFKENLDIPLIHGEASYPEGHGKIERFNQTFKKDLLRHWRGRPDVDPTCTALDARIGHYLKTQYNPRPHEGLGRQVPWTCFEEDSKPLRIPANDDILRSQFVIHERRRVSNDHIVKVDGAHYEMPRGQAGNWVTLERHLLQDNRIFYRHEGDVLELRPVDLEKNARAKRAKPKSRDEESRGPTTGAADRAYEKDTGSLVDTEGNCLVPRLDDDSEQED